MLMVPSSLIESALIIYPIKLFY